jgi:hypothetical protein
MLKKSKVLRAIRINLEQGNLLTVAQEKAGLKSRSTLHTWRKKYPRIDRYIIECSNRSENRRTTIVEDSLFKAAAGGNVGACAFYLKNKAGWKDSPAVLVNATASAQASSNVALTNLKDTELDELVESIVKKRQG